MNPPHPDRSGTEPAILATVEAAPPGTVFAPGDFAGLGSRGAIDTALSRLAARGVLARVARGLYERPRQHPVMGQLLPDIETVVQAIRDKEHIRIQAAGAYAANLLGLSEQVPLKIVFLTDGTPRTLRIGKQEISLRRTTPRNLATAGRISGLVIQALRHLGHKHVDAQTIARLRKRLQPTDRTALAADAPLAPAWIARILNDLARDEASNSHVLLPEGVAQLDPDEKHVIREMVEGILLKHQARRLFSDRPALKTSAG